MSNAATPVLFCTSLYRLAVPASAEEVGTAESEQQQPAVVEESKQQEAGQEVELEAGQERELEGVLPGVIQGSRSSDSI